MSSSATARARDVGIAIGEGRPGPNNAITDVDGVRVGHTTLIDGEGPLVVGKGPVRTGVTVIVPHEGDPGDDPVFAGSHRLNGNGELTGLEWVRESGLLTSPVGLTNTYSVGVVRDALIETGIAEQGGRRALWTLPVVGETYDGLLNDVRGMHVRPEHVETAFAGADAGPVPEGNVGGGTGMICHGFKGGIGTSSRVLDAAAGGYVVGVLVQANYGRRSRFRVDGYPVGKLLDGNAVPLPKQPQDEQRGGSIIVVVATDAPLLPGQCERLAQRAGLAVGRMGGVGENSSGDLFLAFATGNRGLGDPEANERVTVPLAMITNPHVNAFFDAVVEATEEAILNALLAAETMTGRDDATAYRLEPDLLVEALARFEPGSS